MGVIKLLDKEVSQLIAAGEVVERPSSVVKELVENSIDAGASKITVEIRHGGVTLIRVSDNGSGIEPDDVPMMFLRHATSKVRTQEDLSRIATLGFRGEAMASIHAVSHVEVLTRKQGTDEGTCYRGEGGQPGEMTPAGCPAGTTIKVMDLFYNTPARMKFLKKDVQEGNSVAAVVERIALSHPEISFQLIREGQTRLHTPGDGRLLSAIHAVFGKDFTKDLVEVDYTQDSIHVTGYITLPSASRSNRTMQTFFVNGRYVKSMTARAALEEAYKHSIMVGKFPACVLNLSIPYTETDINVHPAKIEVRFTNERPVFDAVYYGVKNTLAKDDRTPLAKPAFAAKKQMTVFDLQRQPQVEQTGLEQAVWKAQKENVPTRMSAQEYRRMTQQPEPKQKMPAAPKAEKQIKDVPLTFKDHDPQTVRWEKENPLYLVEEPHFPKEQVLAKKDTLSHKMFEFKSNENVKNCETKLRDSTQKEEKNVVSPKPEQTFQNIKKQTEKQESCQEIKADPKPEPVRAEPQSEQSKLRLVGEVLGTYLVLEDGEQMILVDKHAAHERLIFNRLKEQKFVEDRQILLEPVMVHLSREDYQAAAQNIELFSQAGFLVEDFGDGDLMVREVPVMMLGSQLQEIIEQTAHNLAKNKKDMTPQALDELLHSVACKSAVRANDKNTMPELWEIVKMLQTDEDARYCPHGRPVAKAISKREIERMFGRLG